MTEEEKEEDENSEEFPTGQGLRYLADIPESQDDVLIGRRLGDYDVTAFIAAGGMSRVYAATRSDGSFERDVAIKVSPVSGLSPDMRDRFVREQAVLATLNHPHITQLYDAHVTDEGWPYIVMEHIDGVPLTEHCTSQKLGLEARVRLFIEIVEAVAYAHARLVIHRDIKPSNVLVDKQGGIKLLDFGIAKLMESDATQTAIGPMTPRYASPEQLLGEAVTVTSDIYQLGLLLSEVLLGKPLIEDDTLTAAIERAAGRIPVTLPANDRMLLPRELVLVIEQCLRANPDDRYSAASELRDDLKAWLRGYPVQAAGQSAGYRFRKFIGRHRVGTAVTTVAVIAGLSAITWYTWQLDNAREEAEASALQATREAEKANQVAEFLKDLLAASKPSNAQGEEVTVRQVLDTGVDKVRNELDEPELKASLLEIMGDVYTDLGDFEQAEELLLEAIDIQRETGDPLSLASAIDEYGQLLRARGEWQASIEVMEEALEIARREGSLEAQAEYLNTLAISSSRLNLYEDAERYHRGALQLRSELYGPDSVEASVSLSGLGYLLLKMGEYDESFERMEAALRIAETELGPLHPLVATRAFNLSTGYVRMGRFSEAEALIRKGMDVDAHVYGPDHYYMATGYLSLAGVAREKLEFANAAKMCEEALRIEMAALGERHVDTGHSRTTLAYYLARSGQSEGVEELIATAEAIFQEAELGEHHFVVQLLRSRGALMQLTGAYPEALGHFEEALEMTVRRFGSDHHRSDLVSGAARAHASMNQFEPAARLFADAVAIIEGESAVVRPILIEAREEYADALEQAGQQDKARVIRDETAALVATAD